MVRENLDNAAVARAALGALPNHALAFVPHDAEPIDPAFEPSQMFPRDGVDGLAGRIWIAGETKDPAHGIQRKAELAGVPDEQQAVDVVLGTTALIAGRAWRRPRGELATAA